LNPPAFILLKVCQICSYVVPVPVYFLSIFSDLSSSLHAQKQIIPISYTVPRIFITNFRVNFAAAGPGTAANLDFRVCWISIVSNLSIPVTRIVERVFFPLKCW
jgi:hypothetical protein